jgi:hypothetical protein
MFSEDTYTVNVRRGSAGAIRDTLQQPGDDYLGRRGRGAGDQGTIENSAVVPSRVVLVSTP